jgi:hypothetical protein
LSMDRYLRKIGSRRTDHMKTTIKRTISFLGIAMMATQLLTTIPARASLQGSSSAFEQAMPATPAQKEVDKLLKQLSSNAAIAGRHAEALDSFTRGTPRLQHETHAAALTGGERGDQRHGRGSPQTPGTAPERSSLAASGD